MRVAIYLRKSRADEELEKTLGEGETLSKHRKALLKFAKEKKLNIVEIKEEIVSGESLFSRPKMLELLKEIENKLYDGVLVMDIQRLGRGNMQDQGIILETFKKSNTKIITPQKTYDLSNDFDEEYTEFEAFMSRKELKMINRRMQGGRVRSIEDGNYIATNPPLGYDITYVKKSRTLKINQNESEIVKLIFKLYTEGNGTGSIADHLNSLGYKTKLGNDFEKSSIIFILKNPTYIGKVTWKKKEIKKSREPGKIKDTRTRDKKDWIIANGKHEAIIDESVFNAAQEILDNKYHIPYQIVNGPVNPLAGILVCGICGSKMVYRPYGDKAPHLICTKCKNKSSRFDYVETAVLKALEEYLHKLESHIQKTEQSNEISVYKNQIESLSKELDTLNSQKLKLFDLLEQGIYSNEIFIERSNNISERSNKIETELEKLNSIIEKQSKKSNLEADIPVKNVLDAYRNSKDIGKKNKLLKSILNRIEYKKSKDQKGDDFDIQLFPRL